MTLDLDNLARLEAAATPGPWNIADTASLPSAAFEVARVGRSAASLSIRAGEPGQDMMRAATGSITADARFIAAARNALPALLADHARLVAEVARLRGVVEAMNPEHNYMALLDLFMDRAHVAEAEVARLAAELDEPITSSITNPAPIAHGLVMARLRCLARNLRDAAGCALAWRLHHDFKESWRIGDCEAWCPNLDGQPAPGWER